MPDPLDVLEQSISNLRRAIRAALSDGETERASELHIRLRRTQRAWDALIDINEPRAKSMIAGQAAMPLGPGAMVPAREHVHRALILLGTPAPPKLVVNVHKAFFPSDLSTSKFTSLRRDEERSYRAAPGARPYYLCPALTYDLLSPARALITISTWPLEQRIIGPLSSRMDFLTGAVRIAEMVRILESTDTGPSEAAQDLLQRFAKNIPGAMPGPLTRHDAVPEPSQVIDAARAEMEVHADADRSARFEAARRARKQLSGGQQLFSQYQV